jgi:signal transduction histidine kinase
LPALSQANLIQSQAYFEDPSGQLTFEEVRQQTFTPYTGILTKGFTSPVFWLRLRIVPPAHARDHLVSSGGFPPAIHTPSGKPEAWVLRVRPPYTDEVELFDPAVDPAHDQGLARVTGNIYKWQDSEFPSVNHGFVLPASDVPRDVWLRIKTTSTMMVGVDVLPYDQMRMVEKHQEMLNLIDVALMLFFIVWASLLFVARPDRIVGAFLLVMVVSFLFATNYMGYYRIFLGQSMPVYLPDLLQSVFVMAMPAAYLFFSRQLLREYRPTPWMMRVLWPMQYYVILGVGLLLLGHVQIALILNLVIGLLGQVWVCAILLFGVHTAPPDSQEHPPVSCRWLLAYSLTVTVLFALVMLPPLGLIEAFTGSLYRQIIQAAVPFVFMAILVHKRNRQLDQWQQRKVVIAEQVAASEKSRREDSEQFLAMLTHEIRTPLTVMAYAAKTNLPDGELGKHVESGIREIDQLIERCLQADQADQVNLPTASVSVSTGQIVRDLKTRFEDPRLQWQIDVKPSITLTTDVALLEIILNNLLDNALKYSHDHAGIALNIKQESRFARAGLVFSVSNPPGPVGFPDRDRLFEKYYRAPRAHIRTGSGLGLYVARSFATNLGGTLTYHPTSDAVCFRLWQLIRCWCILCTSLPSNTTGTCGHGSHCG